MQHPLLPFHPRRQQRGVALFVVLVFVMLSMLLALWASRTAWFNELVVGNDADYQRAFEAAQALLQDAELDIRGERADGLACTPDPAKPKICRRGTTEQFPLEEKEVGPQLSELDNLPSPKCRHGLCAKRVGRQDFWDNITPANGITKTEMMAVDIGARYGEYTGAQIGNGSNPILQSDLSTPANQGGWYWIEILPYDAAAANSALIGNSNASNLALNLQPNVVYRITAVAFGRKMRAPRTGETGDQPLTQVVLQQTYARQKLKD